MVWFFPLLELKCEEMHDVSGSVMLEWTTHGPDGLQRWQVDWYVTRSDIEASHGRVQACEMERVR